MLPVLSTMQALRQSCTWLNATIMAAVLLAASAMLSACSSLQCSHNNIRIPLTIKQQNLLVEVAATPASRQCGLSHRQTLGKDNGMLFVYEKEMPQAFWMKDTLIPLSIAYLDGQKRIINILDMEPFDDELRYRSAQPAQYALEVNQGWFARHRIQPGDYVEFDLSISGN